MSESLARLISVTALLCLASAASASSVLTVSFQGRVLVGRSDARFAWSGCAVLASFDSADLYIRLQERGGAQYSVRVDSGSVTYLRPSASATVYRVAQGRSRRLLQLFR